MLRESPLYAMHGDALVMQDSISPRNNCYFIRKNAGLYAGRCFAIINNRITIQNYEPKVHLTNWPAKAGKTFKLGSLKVMPMGTGVMHK